jgi:hypothetical protein
MDHRTDLTTSIRSAGEWYEVSTDAHLDQRHRNWALSEEMGDVIFVAARGVVLVHRHRAEHIARALGWRPEAAVVALGLWARAGRLILAVDS